MRQLKNVRGKNMNEINHLALLELPNDISIAEKYFVINIKKNPSYITYNNLSWFYYSEEEGHLIVSMHHFKKSKKYCLKALNLKKNLFSQRILREVYYRNGENQKAYDIQLHIMETSKGYGEMYNMGCILLKNGQYNEAQKYLKDAYDTDLLENSKNYSIHIAYAVSLGKTGQYREANQIAENLFRIYERGEDGDLQLHDILTIYYYSGNAGEIFNKIPLLLREYCVQEDVIAIMLFSYKVLCSNVEYESKYAEIIDGIRNDYKENGWRIRRDLNKLKKVHDDFSRGIKPEIFTPGLLSGCNYYGCKSCMNPSEDEIYY